MKTCRQSFRALLALAVIAATLVPTQAVLAQTAIEDAIRQFRILNAFPNNRDMTLTLASSGTLAGQSPVPSGLSVCIEILTQADVKVSK